MINDNSFSGNYDFKRKKNLSARELVKGIVDGDLTALGRAITLIESTNSIHSADAKAIVELCTPHSGKSIRIGITGVPGVGKSTFIESFGTYLIDHHKKKIAVLAIDPSSQKSGGSILGDKTRMHELSQRKEAFIRPSPSSGTLGGVARATRETIILCEAAGFDLVMIETVGVGQSETAVNSMVDFFLLLMLAGAGDELQGIKRGIMELADLLVINKADGDNMPNAKRAKAEFKNALHLFPPKPSGWKPESEVCSSLEKTGLEVIWKHIANFSQLSLENGYFENNRKNQALEWMNQTIDSLLKNRFYKNAEVMKHLPDIKKQVMESTVSPFHAAEQLIKLFQK